MFSIYEFFFFFSNINGRYGTEVWNCCYAYTAIVDTQILSLSSCRHIEFGLAVVARHCSGDLSEARL